MIDQTIPTEETELTEEKLLELANTIREAVPADSQEKQVIPYWLYRKLQGMGVEMEGITYDPMQFREPHPDKPIRYLNRAARRAAQRSHR